jgi:hypothetical protein
VYFIFQILLNVCLKSYAVSAFLMILDMGIPCRHFYAGNMPDVIASAFASLQEVPLSSLECCKQSRSSTPWRQTLPLFSILTETVHILF